MTIETAVNEATVDPAEVEAVMGKAIEELAATAGVLLNTVGIRTGLWRALAGAGRLTAGAAAERAALAEPYVREWLRSQAAAGYVVYDPVAETFTLPHAVAGVFADDVQAGFLDGFARMLQAMSGDLPLNEEAFRTGRGVGWHEHSPAHWDGMDAATRSVVGSVLVRAWLPALEGVEEKLTAGATVGDVGCGYGAPLITMAQAFPRSRFFGFDYHDASIARARQAAAEAGVGDRVRFEVATAKDLPDRRYDLVTYFDTFHDLGDPLGALVRTRDVLADDGTVLLVEFNAGDRVEDNFTPFGRLAYAASALVCTPNALSQEGHPLGTLVGEVKLTEQAHAAGFARVRRTPVEAPVNLLLELKR
ncbi:MAG: class I SAM-dependent methyltransferase [Acidimicrobiia bacterium]